MSAPFVEDKELKKMFGWPKTEHNKILAHRTIRRRLGLSDSETCGILSLALARGIIYRASGQDVGYNGLRKKFYGLVRYSTMKKTIPASNTDTEMVQTDESNWESDVEPYTNELYFEDPMEWAKRVITKFAKKHPYPSFVEVQALLSLNLQLEYGEFDHAYCSEMYQNGFSDKELNQVCGKAIGMRGGFRAM